MLKNFVKIFGGDPNKKIIEQLSGLVEEINSLEPEFESLSDEALRAKTDEFREHIESGIGNVEGLDEKEQFKAEQDALEEILPEAFALVREASKRTIGLRPYDVQLIGGVILHRGSIAEMRTGEGKTLVATMPIYLNALLGKGIHLITVNDYLARRDARWMAPIFTMLGLSIGVLQMAAVTENGKKAFLVDFERESPHEDQQHLRMVDRKLAYDADVTYGTNSEFGFDYLRDNMTMRLIDRVQRGHHYAVIDEVDNVLIDEARTPLIISGPASGNLEWYDKMAKVVSQFKPEDYEVNEKDRNASFTEVGLAHAEQLIGQPLMDPDRPEDVTPEQARLRGYLEQAMRAQFLFKRNKDYLVQGGKVIIIDEFTGRLMPGRRWSDGLHQAVEAKEGVKIEAENVTYATITIQNYFRMYQKLAGMTGTAITEAEEFNNIYKVEVVPVPPNLEYQAFGNQAPLVEVKAKDDDGYTYNYFARREDTQKTPLFYRRKDYPDVIYRTVEAKLRALVIEIVREHILGRPLLIGTTSVESSERLSQRLKAEPVRRLLQIALVRRAWMEANKREEDGRLIPELAQFNEPVEKISPDVLRKFIQPFGLTNISLEDASNLPIVLDILRLSNQDASRLKSVLQGGVPHQVLNARKHTEESQIIAGAGAFGAVTIATNMAGRGVDIKLGGEIAEEVISAVHRVLRKAGHENPFDMTLEERRQLLKKVDPAAFGIYAAEVNHFLQYFEDMERVKELGGLHVVGSERHEARRIDNQLRGRAARQGDPGSSRFYLSLEDELMRIQGGSRVSDLMVSLKVDDSLPLEVRMVGNIIEQSQHRIEGANFDVRKHLLEYDDVLNKQRAQIYSQRDLIFVKEDLTDDIQEMLNVEIKQRVETGLVDEEGPWKLIAWLEQVQPPFMVENRLFPSFGLALLLKELSKADNFHQSVLDIISRAIEAENTHHLNAIEEMIDRTEEAFEAQVSSRMDAVDAYFDGLRDVEETPRPQKMLEEVNALTGVPIKLNNEQLRSFGEDTYDDKETVKTMVKAQLTGLYASRLIASVSNRIGENLGDKFEIKDWDDAADQIQEVAGKAMQRRRERLVGENGQIPNDIDGLMPSELNDTNKFQLFLSLSQGARTAFDQRTHRQVKQVFNRFSYIFLIAQLLDGYDASDLTEEVLEHLENADESLRLAIGQSEFNRLSANATRLADFGPAAQMAFGGEKLNDAVASMGESDREALTESIGKYILNEIRRQLLLGATSELWVEYLTHIEALRVSIGLEAYAQRDPLVQYKTKASEMFAQLVEDIRGLVVSRAFAAQRRSVEITPVETSDAPEVTQSIAADENEKEKETQATLTFRSMATDRVTASLNSYRALPKVELHRHLEGSLRLDTMVDIARQHGIEIPADVLRLSTLVQVQEEDKFTFQNFLSKFNTLRMFYRSPDVIHRITREAVEDAAKDNVKYMELRFTPVALSRAERFPLHDVIDWVMTSSQEAAKKYGVVVKLIASVNRHESTDLAEQVAWLAAEHIKNGIVALDLAGNEAEFKSEPFYGIFKEAKQAGLHVTIHAGEWGPAIHVKEAIEELGTDRIGHGVRVLEDQNITALARERQTAFEVCITSNYQSGVVTSLETHPLMQLIDAGLNVTINTDDPSISRITLSHEYYTACEELHLQQNALKKRIVAAAEAGFLPDNEKEQLVNQLKKDLKM